MTFVKKRPLFGKPRKKVIFICSVSYSPGHKEDLWFDPARPLDGECIFWVRESRETHKHSSWTTTVDWVDEVQEKVDDFIGTYRRMDQGKRVAAMIERK